MALTVTATRIRIPAMSTMGYGWGTTDDGRIVEFTGDHRPMRDIGEAIAAARDETELPTVVVEDLCILRVEAAE